MMYKDTPYVNKLIKKRQHERSMDYHLENIRQAKPITRSPDSEMLHINKKKKEYQKEVRFTEIERQNRILLEKISSIMGKDKRKTFNQTSKTNKSLNSGFRKRQLQGIEIQNAKFLRRLQDKKSDYQTSKFKEDWKKQKNTMKIMANYPLILTDRPKIKRHSIGNFNHKSKIDNSDIEIVRVRVLSGINFLVTVRLTDRAMQITGDCKETKQIKVIQIQKAEALEFIEEECQGRIDLIFDHLRYDKGQGVLYLIGNQVEIDDILGRNREDEEIKNRREEEKQRRQETERAKSKQREEVKNATIPQKKQTKVNKEKVEENAEGQNQNVQQIPGKKSKKQQKNQGNKNSAQESKQKREQKQQNEVQEGQKLEVKHIQENEEHIGKQKNEDENILEKNEHEKSENKKGKGENLIQPQTDKTLEERQEPNEGPQENINKNQQKEEQDVNPEKEVHS